MINRIKINALFNKYDYDLHLNEKLNVLVGENGCGKSTILRIINYIFNNDYVSLANIIFDEITIVYDNKPPLIIKKDDIIPIKGYNNPEFRYLLIKNEINNFNTFDDFFNSILKYSFNSLKDSNIDSSYVDDIEKYKVDDLIYFDISKSDYQNVFNTIKVKYGSKYYLNIIYSLLKGEKIIYNKYYTSLYRTYVDDVPELKSIVDEKLSNINNLSKKYFDDKELIYDGKFLVKDLKNKNNFDFKNLSSGERKIYSLLKTICESSEEMILLLDEPELSLSIYWQKFLIDDLLNNCKANKVIIASQSSFLLDDSEIKYIVPIFQDDDYDE